MARGVVAHENTAKQLYDVAGLSSGVVALLWPGVTGSDCISCARLRMRRWHGAAGLYRQRFITSAEILWQYASSCMLSIRVWSSSCWEQPGTVTRQEHSESANSTTAASVSEHIYCIKCESPNVKESEQLIPDPHPGQQSTHSLALLPPLKRDTDRLKHWHLGPYSLGHYRQSHRPAAKGCYFEHLLWSRHRTNTFHSHSHYWEEENISFRFLCNVRWCRNITKVRWQIMYAFNS